MLNHSSFHRHYTILIAIAALLAGVAFTAKTATATAALRDKIFFLSKTTSGNTLTFARINDDGSGRQNLFQLPFRWRGNTNNSRPDVVFSPDGTKVAFQLDADERLNVNDVALINLNQPDTVIKLSHGSSKNEMYDNPRFSPDSQKVVFQGRKEAPTGWYYNDVYLANSDGSGFQQLTHTPAGAIGNESQPVFSPDSQRIIFTRNGGLYQMGIDGSNQQNLLADRSLPVAGRGAEPLVSPDGTKLVYPGSFRSGEEEDLYLVNLQSLQISNLTNTPEMRDSHAVFSPDSSKILYRSKLQNDFYESGFSYGDIKIMNADGSGKRNITTNAGYQHEPVFSSDGKRIAFTSAPSIYATWSIHTINVDGSNEKSLTSEVPDADHAYLPAWRLVEAEDTPPPPPPAVPSAFKAVKGSLTLRHGKATFVLKGGLEPKSALGNIQLTLTAKKAKKPFLAKTLTLRNGAFALRVVLKNRRVIRSLRKTRSVKLSLNYSGVTRNGRVEISPVALVQTIKLQRK